MYKREIDFFVLTYAKSEIPGYTSVGINNRKELTA
jgi:hypothetical protein